MEDRAAPLPCRCGGLMALCPVNEVGIIVRRSRPTNRETGIPPGPQTGIGIINSRDCGIKGALLLGGDVGIEVTGSSGVVLEDVHIVDAKQPLVAKDSELRARRIRATRRRKGH
jgi:hypothetical protein